MKIYKIIFSLIIILIAGASFAQNDEQRKQFGNGIDSIIRQKVIEKLGIDEFTADKFITIYKEDNKKMRMIMKEKKELMKVIEQDPGAIDIDSKLDKIFQLESDILEQRKSFFTELKTFLTSQQVAKTLIIRKNFEKEFRKQVSRLKDGKRHNDKENDDKGLQK